MQVKQSHGGQLLTNNGRNGWEVVASRTTRRDALPTFGSPVLPIIAVRRCCPVSVPEHEECRRPRTPARSYRPWSHEATRVAQGVPRRCSQSGSSRHSDIGSTLQ